MASDIELAQLLLREIKIAANCLNVTLSYIWVKSQLRKVAWPISYSRKVNFAGQHQENCRNVTLYDIVYEILSLRTFCLEQNKVFRRIIFVYFLIPEDGWGPGQRTIMREFDWGTDFPKTQKLGIKCTQIKPRTACTIQTLNRWGTHADDQSHGREESSEHIPLVHWSEYAEARDVCLHNWLSAITPT